ncbi:hypothetical protein M426DRAFT_322943 [Hypoxylon sp. CI-4A]|nr:hypothetical protein M426DRAFT_322943 [Hypoxylon sp. CI-4A]
MATSTLGPLVRLWGLHTEQLPPPSATADELTPLLVAILQEAVPFIDSAAPKEAPNSKADPRLWKPKGNHAHADSKARVEVLERIIPAAELEKVKGSSQGKVKAETWCCRRSVHEDREETGSASWDEFVACFREHHAESEKAFTPACLDAHEALRWDCSGVVVDDVQEGGVAWTGLQLRVEEMRHRIGKPVLKDRTFPVLQVTASSSSSSSSSAAAAAADGDEFVVVSIPVPDFGEASDRSKLAKEKGAQIAFYVSVERIRKTSDGRIEWLMATASDAAGVLPAWVQNLAAPGVIWKDVPLFLGWVARERQKEEQPDGEEQRNGGREAAPQASSTGAEADDDVSAVSDVAN